MIKACIFDLDGTLADTLSTIANYGNTALSTCGYKTIEKERYKKLVGDGRDELIRRMLREVGDNDLEGFDKVKKTYDVLYQSDVIGTTKLFDGVKDTLTELKKMQIKIAVLSNKQHEVVPFIIEELFGKGFFDACLGQMDSLPKKPQPDGALLIAEQFNIKGEECLYVGDTDVDMKTGKAAGMYTAGALWGFRDEEELTKGGAAYILHSPKEILDVLGKID